MNHVLVGDANNCFFRWGTQLTHDSLGPPESTSLIYSLVGPISIFSAVLASLVVMTNKTDTQTDGHTHTERERDHATSVSIGRIFANGKSRILKGEKILGSKGYWPSSSLTRSRPL